MNDQVDSSVKYEYAYEYYIYIYTWQFCKRDLFGMVSLRDPNSKAK